MDPYTLIVAAIAAGAHTALTSTAEKAIIDSYNALKNYLRDKFSIDTSQIEKMPNSEKKQDSLKEDLENAEAKNDPELLIKTQTLLELIKNQVPDHSTIIGIDLKNVEIGKTLTISNVESSGIGVRIQNGKIQDDLNISDVKAGGNNNNEKK